MANLLDLFDKVSVLESFAKVLEGAEIINADLNVKNNQVSVKLKSSSLIDEEQLFGFIEQAKNKYALNILEVEITYDGVEFDKAYGENLIKILCREIPSCKMFLKDATAFLEGDKIIIKSAHGGASILKNSDIERAASRIARGELGRGFDCEIICEEFDKEAYIKAQEELTEEKSKEAATLWRGKPKRFLKSRRLLQDIFTGRQ